MATRSSMTPTPADALRTSLVVVTRVVPLLARLAVHRSWPAPATTTEDGLAHHHRAFGAALRALRIDLEVRHAERVPRDGGVVLMFNQESHLEHLVLATAAPRPFFTLYNNEVARIPAYGEHLRSTGHVHLDRTDERQWRPGILAAAARVAAGECALISPEGTRSRDGQLLPFKRGALLLATSSERPVVCVTVIGGHACLPRGSLIVRRGPVRVVFSEPIPPLHDDEVLRARLVATFEQTKVEHAL